MFVFPAIQLHKGPENLIPLGVKGLSDPGCPDILMNDCYGINNVTHIILEEASCDSEEDVGKVPFISAQIG